MTMSICGETLSSVSLPYFVVVKKKVKIYGPRNF